MFPSPITFSNNVKNLDQNQ